MARCPGLMALKVLQTVVKHTASCNALGAGQMDGGEMCVRGGKGTWGVGSLGSAAQKWYWSALRWPSGNPPGEERARERERRWITARENKLGVWEWVILRIRRRESEKEGGPVKWRMIACHETSYSTQMSGPFTLTSLTSSKSSWVKYAEHQHWKIMLVPQFPIFYRVTIQTLQETVNYSLRFGN